MNKKRLFIIIGIVVVVVALVIVFDTTLANRRPAITSLKAEPATVLPWGSCQIVCNATDADGDELSYAWSASGGILNTQGATVSWKAPPAVGSYNVTVTVSDGRGGIVTDAVTITVRTNRAPIITSLIADADWTLPSGSLQVTCAAQDYDGDELSYEWSTTGGNISGTGTVVNWIAPEEVGVYDITVMVKDDYGSSDTRTLPISVVTGQPPIIEALVITKDRYGHCYLKPYYGGYYVGQEKMYDIECIASHPDGFELSYDWECDGGEISEISEDGSMITWTAPNPAGSIDVTVTVIVSDIAGNMASKNLVLKVVECSTCTFHC